MTENKHKALVKNAADKKQVKKAAELEKERDHEYLQDIKNVMSTESGRRVMWHIINNLCHYDRSSAANSGSITYMNEGEREIGRLLKSDVYEAAFEDWQRMEKEHVTKALDQKLLDKSAENHK